MKKKYESPEFEIFKLKMEDILRGIDWSEPEDWASGGQEGGDDDPFLDP